MRSLLADHAVVWLAIGAAAVAMSFAILVRSRSIGQLLGVMDEPDGFRKTHESPTPLVAGMGILFPLFFWCVANILLHASVESAILKVVLLCGFGTALVGYMDDRRSTSPSIRLFAVLLFSSIALVIDPNLIPTQIRWEGVGVVHIPQWIAFPFAVLSLTGFVNAVNMADGQNGLVIGLVIIWSMCLAMSTSGTAQSTSILLCGASLIAFAFNMSGRSFLGDSGAYGLGFVVGVMAIWAHNSWGVSAQTVGVWFFVPVLDCLRLIANRLGRGYSSFGADRNHFHHRLQHRFGMHASLTVYLGVVGAASVCATVFPPLASLILIVLASIYFSLAWLDDFLAGKGGPNVQKADGNAFQVTDETTFASAPSVDNRIQSH